MFTDGFFRRWLWIYCHIYKIQYGGWKFGKDCKVLWILSKIIFFNYLRKIIQQFILNSRKIFNKFWKSYKKTLFPKFIQQIQVYLRLKSWSNFFKERKIWKWPYWLRRIRIPRLAQKWRDRARARIRVNGHTDSNLFQRVDSSRNIQRFIFEIKFKKYKKNVVTFLVVRDAQRLTDFTMRFQ